jgi:hypothetical protein
MNAMPAIAPGVGPLRLTRRGRLVVAVAVALLIAVVMLIATGTAQATSSPPSPGRPGDLAQVVVGPGQSLWSVAESADPDQDPRIVIQQIITINALAGDVVYAGQRLWVPRG